MTDEPTKPRRKRVSDFVPGAVGNVAENMKARKQRKSTMGKKAAEARRKKLTDPDKLTPLERAFVLNYIGASRYNARDAMEKAGYSPKQATTTILYRPHVMRAIAKVMEERNKALKLDAQTVLAEAWECYMACVAKGDYANARGFLEQVGKHVDVQAFRAQVGLSSPNGGPVEFDVSGLTTDEKIAALALLERLGAVQPGTPDSGAARLH